MGDRLSTQEMNQLKFTVAETRTAICPTCESSSDFVLCGTQTWPARVAEAAGMPEVMTVWNCQTCGTTLLAPNLKFDEA